MSMMGSVFVVSKVIYRFCWFLQKFIANSYFVKKNIISIALIALITLILLWEKNWKFLATTWGQTPNFDHNGLSYVNIYWVLWSIEFFEDFLLDNNSFVLAWSISCMWGQNLNIRKWQLKVTKGYLILPCHCIK